MEEPMIIIWLSIVCLSHGCDYVAWELEKSTKWRYFGWGGCVVVLGGCVCVCVCGLVCVCVILLIITFVFQQMYAYACTVLCVLRVHDCMLVHHCMCVFQCGHVCFLSGALSHLCPYAAPAPPTYSPSV